MQAGQADAACHSDLHVSSCYFFAVTNFCCDYFRLRLRCYLREPIVTYWSEGFASVPGRANYAMQAKELETEMDAVFVDVEYQISVESCKDHDVSHTCVLKHMTQTDCLREALVTSEVLIELCIACLSSVIAANW